jgi:hypothetical protein
MKKSEYPDWLVPLELSKELKKIGFNEPCYFKYDSEGVFFSDYVNATEKGEFLANIYINLREGLGNIPTWEQAFSWFRKKSYEANIDYVFHPDLKCKIGYLYEIIYDFTWEKFESYYISYEIARKECLKELIKLYKNENNKI